LVGKEEPGFAADEALLHLVDLPELLHGRI